MLHRALLSLIPDRDYEAITVAEICERAEVGRSTFYAHYANKDDLMRSGLKTMRKAFPDPVPNTATDQAFAFSLPTLEHARAHMHIHRALDGNRGGEIALDMVRQILSDQIRKELAVEAGDPITREFIVQYLVGAHMAVTSWWIGRGAKLAPAEVDAMFQRLAIDGVESFRG